MVRQQTEEAMWAEGRAGGEGGREPRSLGSHHKLGGKEAPVLGLPEGAQPGQYNWLGASGLRNGKKINVCCLGYQASGNLLGQPQEPDTRPQSGHHALHAVQSALSTIRSRWALASEVSSFPYRETV